MEHVFFIHSNICSIVVYNTVKSILVKGEKVRIMLDRSAKWCYNTEGISFIDTTPIMLEYNGIIRTGKHSIRNMLKLRKIIKKLEQYSANVIGCQDFILYITQYRPPLSSIFCENKYCKGFYYFEEGTMSYRTLEYVKKITGYSMFRDLISNCLGLRYHSFFHINEKFRGTISIDNHAFPWNQENRILNKCETVNTKDFNYNIKRNIIIMGPMYRNTDNVEEVKTCLGYLNEKIGGLEKMAIKFHPLFSKEEKEKIEKICVYAQSMGIEVLSNEFVVEFNLIQSKANIYSLFSKSSLALYAFLLGGRAYDVKQEMNGYSINEVKKLEDIIIY